MSKYDALCERALNPEGPLLVDAIRTLETENAELRGALEPFAKAADVLETKAKNGPDGNAGASDNWNSWTGQDAMLDLSDLRAARLRLSSAG